MLIRRLAAIGLLLCAAMTGASAQTTAAWTLGTLMSALSGVRSASADFTETKTMALLKTPLQTSGTLRYVAPDYMRKTVLSPTVEDFVLQSGVVTLTAQGQTHRFDLTQAPPLAGLVEGVRATLAGDEATLRRYYTMSLSGGPQQWQLLLRPTDPALGRLVSWLSIRGSGARVTEIDTGGAHGDLTRMSVRESVADTN
jgi:Outer membrane lipoprotein carrier protein LolA-like